MSNKQSSIDFIITEIDNELRVIESLEGVEIMGRKISLHFAKRISEQAKEMHKQEIIDAWEDGQGSFSTRNEEQYYNETFD